MPLFFPCLLPRVKEMLGVQGLISDGVVVEVDDVAFGLGSAFGTTFAGAEFVRESSPLGSERCDLRGMVRVFVVAAWVPVSSF